MQDILPVPVPVAPPPAPLHDDAVPASVLHHSPPPPLPDDAPVDTLSPSCAQGAHSSVTTVPAATTSEPVRHPMITRARAGVSKPNPRYAANVATDSILPDVLRIFIILLFDL
ncbi:hypothetical protein E2562_000269 [Oryza meyeriana var. granulata]|uniref:Uncharacterized protein n=1 Tax=Oryza meyeriana var. granulata TaxID=110450 RepID=A0A6G1CLR5_9ORYZ|nr:hypothetical protein E2562_000269 [Oryza meyeriana var. granulata]